MPQIARAYHRRGFEVVVGMHNFFLRACPADLVHFLWPEEFSEWRPPTPRRLADVEESLSYWAERATTIFGVNNTWPHGREGDPVCHRLYSAFFETCDLVLHHSRASREAVLADYEAARGRRHVVSTMFNYDVCLTEDMSRADARGRFGFADDEFVVLVFGALRNRAELQLLTAGFSQAKTPRKRLLMAGRYTQVSSTWGLRWRRRQWNRFLRKVDAVTVDDFIPEEDVHRYFTAADVVVVPRLKDLSSGVVGLAMTFGKLLVAPNHGAFPDYLHGSPNLLYRSGDAADLSRAIDAAARMDREAAARANRAVADTWTWDRILGDALREIDPRSAAPVPVVRLASAV